jgi:hypothetical protein
MSQLVKTKRQTNFKDLSDYGAFKGLVEQKTSYSNRSCVTSVLQVYKCHKEPNLHTNSLNNILFLDTLT